jgi:hypothetical protein
MLRSHHLIGWYLFENTINIRLEQGEIIAPGGAPGGAYGCNLELMGSLRCVDTVGVLCGAPVL